MACLLWGWVGSSRVVHQVRYQPQATPADYGLAWEPLALATCDRIRISGWLIRHPHPTGVLILLHGFGTGKADLLDIAQAFHRNGSYTLALIDFRGHGFSAGATLSFGLREVWDIEALLDFISQDPALKNLPIGCYGISMGGAIGILAAARFPAIRAVVSDSAYSDLPKAIARVQRIAYHIPRVPLGQMVIWGTELRLGCRLPKLNPRNVIGKISPRAALVIHGMQDKSVPFQEAQALFDAAKEPRELWLVSEAEHVASFYRNQKEYLERVLVFFDHALRRAT